MLAKPILVLMGFMISSISFDVHAVSTSCIQPFHVNKRLTSCFLKDNSTIVKSIITENPPIYLVGRNGIHEMLKKWNDAKIPFCQIPEECGIHLNWFISVEENGSFPRVGLNISTTIPLVETLTFFYHKDTLPQDCFISVDKTGENCNNVVGYQVNSLHQAIVCPLNESDVYTTFKFIGNGKKMQYTFRNVFRDKLIHNGTIFLYSHYSDKSQNIMVTFQAIYGVQNYLIKLYPVRQNDNCVKTLNVNLSDVTTYTTRFENLVTLTISKAALKHGRYELIVQCQQFVNHASNETRCCSSSLPFEINIEAKYGMWEVALTATLLLFTLCVVVIIMVTYLRWQVLKPIMKPAKLLLIYDSVNFQHSGYVKTTRVFLQELLGIQVLLDSIDIPLSEHNNPFEWYVSSIHEADYVAIVVPPKILPDEAHRGGPYRNVFKLSINLLMSRIENGLENRLNLSTKYLIFVLPDSHRGELPLSQIETLFAGFGNCFEIPSDFLYLRQHIQFSLNRTFLHVRLPRCFLSSRSRNNELFYKMNGDVAQQNKDPLPLLPIAEYSPNEESELLCLFNIEGYLNESYGKHITSVTKLPSVIASATVVS